MAAAGAAIRGVPVVRPAYKDQAGRLPDNGPAPVIIDARLGAFPLLTIVVASGVVIGSKNANTFRKINGGIAGNAIGDRLGLPPF